MEDDVKNRGKNGKYGSFEHLLFLLSSSVCLYEWLAEEKLPIHNTFEAN